MVERPLLGVAAAALRALLVVLLALAAVRAGERLAARLAVAGEPDLTDIERALAWDLTQPEIHFEAARQLSSRLEILDLDRAEGHLDEAVRLNPHEWVYRLEKGRLLERRGLWDEAEAVLLDALKDTPHHPSYRWRVANFYVRRGEPERALEHLRIALAGSRALLDSGFALLRRLEMPAERILGLWPRDTEASRRLFRLLVGSPPQRVDAKTETTVRELWRRMGSDGVARRIGDVALYQRFLILHGAMDEARSEWIAAARALGWPTETFEARRDLVWNGGFELPLARGPLAWYAAEKEAVTARRVQTVEAVEGASLLSLEIRGREHGEFVSVSQQIVATREAGTWQLTGFLRSSGARWTFDVVVDLVTLPERRVLFESEALRPGASWIEVSGTIELEQAPAARLLLLRVRPSPSPSGTMSPDSLWLDAFGLIPVQPGD